MQLIQKAYGGHCNFHQANNSMVKLERKDKLSFLGAGLHETGVDIYRSFQFRKLVHGIDPVRARVIFQDIAMVMEQGIRACKAEADRRSHIVQLILYEKAAKHPRSVRAIPISTSCCLARKMSHCVMGCIHACHDSVLMLALCSHPSCMAVLESLSRQFACLPKFSAGILAA